MALKLRNGLAPLFLTEPPEEGDERSSLERLISFAIPTGPWDREPVDGKRVEAIGTTRELSLKRAFWSRFVGSMIGGAFLVGPMWLLVSSRDIYGCTLV